MKKTSYRAIGLMSGTSVDSIDAAAVKVDISEGGEDIQLIKGISYPIPDCVRQLIFSLFEDGAGSLHRLSLLNIRLGYLFAEAVVKLLKEAGLKAEEVAVIGSHGQTVYHVSLSEECCGKSLTGSTQIGEASVIAQRTGIPVVSDFRTADIAAGGTGAPLAPFLDLLIFKDPERDTAVQNIGGIGNVTWIPKDRREPIAFDTGPGNMIIDFLVERYTDGRLSFDRDGEIGEKGNVDGRLLEVWMNHPFFLQKPPKSTGREEFGTCFFSTYIKERLPSPDLIRTAEEFTAHSIQRSYTDFLPRVPGRVIVTGGGSHNPVIMRSLCNYFGKDKVFSGEQAGIDSDYKEAIAFALMGLWRLLGRANNVPSATGAERAVVMGKLSLP
ncbi:MAG: anhydro-N-acetylmuramic acid kinase [Spirochaetota bacterium]